MILPGNLPLLVNDPREEAREVVTRILKDDLTLQDILCKLSKFWKIKVWFDKPIEIVTRRHWKTEVYNGELVKVGSSYKTSDVHVFSKFFMYNNFLCYAVSKNRGKGYYFEWLDNIIRYEPVIKPDDVFENYEQFKKKFDPKFITEDAIKNLWNSHSYQHGDKYKPSDFRAIGPVGRKVMKDFLRLFGGIGTGGEGFPGYSKSICGDYYVLRTAHYSTHHSGRDISISHQTNCPYVFYASEFHGCGNGRYGIVADERTYLWTDDD